MSYHKELIKKFAEFIEEAEQKGINATQVIITGNNFYVEYGYEGETTTFNTQPTKE